MKRRYDPLDKLRDPPPQPYPVEAFEVTALRKELASVSLQLAKSQDQAESLQGRVDLLERHAKDERLFWGGLLENAQKRNAILMAENAAARIEVVASNHQAHLSAQQLKHHEDLAVLDKFTSELQVRWSEEKRAAAEKECQRLRDDMARYQQVPPSDEQSKDGQAG